MARTSRDGFRHVLHSPFVISAFAGVADCFYDTYSNRSMGGENVYAHDAWLAVVAIGNEPPTYIPYICGGKKTGGLAHVHI